MKIYQSSMRVWFVTQSDHANTELIQELTENTVTGGVAMINHALAELWTGEEKYDLLMHDWYLAC